MRYGTKHLKKNFRRNTFKRYHLILLLSEKIFIFTSIVDKFYYRSTRKRSSYLSPTASYIYIYTYVGIKSSTWFKFLNTKNHSSTTYVLSMIFFLSIKILLLLSLQNIFNELLFRILLFNISTIIPRILVFYFGVEMLKLKKLELIK